MDYPYIQVFARTASDATATVNVQISEEAYGVNQQAVIDAIKTALNPDGDVPTLTATKYEMNLTTTQM